MKSSSLLTAQKESQLKKNILNFSDKKNWSEKVREMVVSVEPQTRSNEAKITALQQTLTHVNVC